LIDHFDKRPSPPFEFDDVATGAGATPAEAVGRALSQLEGRGWQVDGFGARITTEVDGEPFDGNGLAPHDCYVVSIRVR
jgi:hypothetical protein